MDIQKSLAYQQLLAVPWDLDFDMLELLPEELRVLHAYSGKRFTPKPQKPDYRALYPVPETWEELRAAREQARTTGPDLIPEMPGLVRG
jgi:hypothetical protein